MAELNPFARILALPNDSRAKTLAMAFAVSAVCSLAVSFGAVVLQPMIEANRAAERQARLDALIERLPGLTALLAESAADTMETLSLDLATLEPVDEEPPEPIAAIADPDASNPIPPEQDLAALGRRPNAATIHVLRDGDAVEMVILPVMGRGYQSIIQGFLALGGDLNTIAALTITRQGETPGLGARIEEADWQALWPGTELRDAEGTLRVSVVRGGATNEYEVDGITGATRTSNGIQNMIRFWVGPEGYGPLLDALAEGSL
ncbi:MAG: FMN-binding protein [Rubricella sp.]